jgi:serine/threonine protein kinase
MQIEVLGDRYQLQDQIGRGGMATIYRGRDLHMDSVVAIKVLREVYSTDPKFVTRFQREAKAASALQHPNIVQVYDYGQTGGNYFIVMELVEGTDLRRYLRSRGVLDIERAVIIAHDVALGLGAAHRRGIVHRDVKPQNILVGRDGSIKLTDFGIASVYKDINAERLTTTGMTLGTVQYYAPEQAQGEIVSPAADVYALGIVMYEMLTGRTPFDGDSPVAVAMQHIQDPPLPPSQLNPNIDPALEEIILRCLEKVPEMRFRDGSQLARALEQLFDNELDGAVAGSTTSGESPAPITFGQIPPRPSTSGRGPARSTQLPEPVSFPDNALNGNIQPGQNSAGGVPGAIEDDRTIRLDQQRYPISPMPIPESGTTSPFQQGTVPRSGTVQQKQGDSRFSAIITIFILLAALLLLGFSIYLADKLGVISLPFFNGSITPTPGIVEVRVPDLKGKSYQDAQTTAASLGFKLHSENGIDGIVIYQNPTPDERARQGATIDIKMGPKMVTVPDNLAGQPLASAETILTQAGLKYKVVPDGNNANVGPNIISRTSPQSGSSIPANGTVTVYVWNYTTATPTATPTTAPATQPTPTPTPTPKVTPSPTPTLKPSPSPSPSPSPIPDPIP